MLSKIRSRLGQFVDTRPYAAVRPWLKEPFVRESTRSNGVLLRIRPFETDQGIVDGAGFLRSLHDVSTTLRGKNASSTTSFEVWFDRGRLGFYLHAATADAAAKLRRRIGSHYTDAEVVEVTDDPAFPVVDPGDFAAGARIESQRVTYYPIRQHHVEGFEEDPYGDLTGELLAGDDTSVVTQIVFRPAKDSWTSGSRCRRDGVDELAYSLRQGTSVGWLNPRRRPPTESDKRAAELIERQRGRQAFHTNVRVLAVSPEPDEARARAAGVAGVFTKRYNSPTGQGFTDVPVHHRVDRFRARKLRMFLRRMAERRLLDRGMTLTVDELAGIAHVPGEGLETSAVDWRRSRRGGHVPPEAAEFDPTARGEHGDV